MRDTGILRPSVIGELKVLSEGVTLAGCRAVFVLWFVASSSLLIFLQFAHFSMIWALKQSKGHGIVYVRESTMAMKRQGSKRD